MANIIRPSRFVSQPQYAARIDYSHPANRYGVELSFNAGAAAAPFDAATGRLITKSATGVTRVGTSRGVAYDFAAASSPALLLPNGKPLTAASGVVVFDARDLSNAVTSVGRLFDFNSTSFGMLAGDDGGTFDNCVAFFLTTTSGNSFWIKSGFVDGGKYSVAFAWDGTNVSTSLRFGVDGAVSGATSTQITGAGVALDNSADRRIGNRNTNDRPFDGAISLLHVVPAVWDDGLLQELSINPWQLYAPIRRRVFFTAPAGADLTVDIDTAGSITVEGQEVAVSLGVALDAGAVTIEGQSATLALGVDLDAGAINIEGQAAAVTLGVNLDEAGAILIEGQDATTQVGANLAVTIDTPGEITIAGQSVTVALGVDLANAGQINIEGQSATLALGLNVDEAGSILIGGEDVAAVVSGDLDIPIEVAGSILIEGQECAITLTQPATGVGGPTRRRPRKVRPEDLPAFKVDIDFLQPWQECRATVEVSDEFDFEFFQEGALANMTAEAITEVEIDARQEVAELMATLSAVPMRGVAVKSMPRVETARVSVSVSQAPSELSLLVSVE